MTSSHTSRTGRNGGTRNQNARRLPVGAECDGPLRELSNGGEEGDVANGYIGHGVETDDKLVHFEGIMDWTVEMCSGKHKETPFYYIDLNAGSGQPIPGRDLIGSPLLAAEILHRRYGDASYQMVCVEQNGANLEEIGRASCRERV